MAVVIDGVEKRIGLALSGGGFRAAAFHLGVMQHLQTLGLLDKGLIEVADRSSRSADL
jgi:NTE family protein